MNKNQLPVATNFVPAITRRNQQPHHSIRSVFGSLLGAALLVTFLTAGSAPAHAQFVDRTSLILQNGWTAAPFATSRATVEVVSGIAQFKGAISSGTSAVAFTLGAAFRPLTDVYIKVDTCNATNARIHITPAGVADVEVPIGGSFTNAQCFTSLDGASFALRTTGYTNLTLVNGWTNAPFSTSDAQFRLVSGVVHFKGAIATSGTNAVPFTMPAGVRPATDVYIPIDLCNAANGRIHITPGGVADIETATFSDAQCFTSLDGAWYVPSATGFTPLTLINGWTNAPFSTSNAAAGNAYGLVYFKGAIATSGASAQPFTLAPAFRPLHNTYIPIDLCGATNGRLYIQNNGTVSVQAETAFSNAQCFTSLDGASFVQ
jgi:hypothetical protein